MSATIRPDARAPLAVRFTRSWQIYMAGDVATFPARIAGDLVAQRIAQRVNLGHGPAPDGAPLAMRGPAAMVTKT